MQTELNILLGFWPLVKVFSRENIFSRENKPYFEFAKVFSAKSVPKIGKRESFCQKISRSFGPAKVVQDHLK